MRDNFFHRPAKDDGKPGSGGCVIPSTAAGESEVNGIVSGLGFETNDTIKWQFTEPYRGSPKPNIE